MLHASYNYVIVLFLNVAILFQHPERCWGLFFLRGVTGSTGAGTKGDLNGSSGWGAGNTGREQGPCGREMGARDIQWEGDGSKGCQGNGIKGDGDRRQYPLSPPSFLLQ